MIEPFGFSRLLLLKKLEKKGTPFGLQRELTRPESPFWRAISSYTSLYAPNIRTYVMRKNSDGEVLSGAVQLFEYPGRPEAEVIYITPALSTHPDAADLWLQLLIQTVKQAGSQGTQRLFASVLWDGDEIEVFRQVGFLAYAREEVLRLSKISTVERKFPLNGWRRLRSGDEVRLQEFHFNLTPCRVRTAEGQNIPVDWVAMYSRGVLRGEEAYVFEAEEDGPISGLLHIRPGKIGHWLEVRLAQNSEADIDELLDFGLERIANWSPRPIYSAVREYQGGVLPALYERGFEPYARQAVMMKNTVVWVKESLPVVLSTAEKRVGPSAPTVTLLNGEAIPDGISQPMAAVTGSSHD